MSTLTPPVQHCTGGINQGNETRQETKGSQIAKELLIVEDTNILKSADSYI